MTAELDTPAPTSAADAAATDGKAADAARRPGRRRTVIIATALGLALVAGGGGTAAALSKSVTVVVDGQPQQVRTFAGSVAGALAAADQTAGEHDIVAPSVDAPVHDGDTIALQKAKPFTLDIDGRQQQAWTTADTVEEALIQLGQDPSAYQLSADRSREIPLDGLEVAASPLHPVTLTVGGTPQAIESGAATVGDLLAAQGVTVNPTDTVTPDPSTPVTDGLQITVDRVVLTTVTDTVAIPAPEQHVEDPNANKGTSTVTQQGVPGEQQVTTQVTTVNGAETGRQETGRVTTREPVPTIISDGTKSSLEWRGSRVFFNDTEFGVNWDGLAYCESTNNPKATFYPSGFPATFGLFQFDLPTWQSVGGSGNPMDASPEEQLMRAKMLYQKRGLEPWLCGYAASSPPPA